MESIRLFADDTLLELRSEEEMNTLLNTIEEEAAYYGLRLNKSKCKHLDMNINFPGWEMDLRRLGMNLGALGVDLGAPSRHLLNYFQNTFERPLNTVPLLGHHTLKAWGDCTRCSFQNLRGVSVQYLRG